MKKLALVVLMIVVFVLPQLVCDCGDVRNTKAYKVSSCSGEASQCQKWAFSEDEECTIENLPDGLVCPHFKEASFCILSCVCEAGEAKYSFRECDDGNPCTTGKCGAVSQPWMGGYHYDLKHEARCGYFPVDDGLVCGPDDGGECRQGLCVMSDGKVFLEFSFPSEEEK